MCCESLGQWLLMCSMRVCLSEKDIRDAADVWLLADAAILVRRSSQRLLKISISGSCYPFGVHWALQSSSFGDVRYDVLLAKGLADICDVLERRL